METMIKIKNTWLEKYFCKDIITIEELIDFTEDKLDEIDYLKEEIQDLKEKQLETAEEHYIDDYHEKKVLGMLDE